MKRRTCSSPCCPYWTAPCLPGRFVCEDCAARIDALARRHKDESRALGTALVATSRNNNTTTRPVTTAEKGRSDEPDHEQ
jgi:hypothetical protein